MVVKKLPLCMPVVPQEYLLSDWELTYQRPEHSNGYWYIR